MRLIESEFFKSNFVMMLLAVISLVIGVCAQFIF